MSGPGRRGVLVALLGLASFAIAFAIGSRIEGDGSPRPASTPARLSGERATALTGNLSTDLPTYPALPARPTRTPTPAPTPSPSGTPIPPTVTPDDGPGATVTPDDTTEFPLEAPVE